ncbi:MAG: DNA polymerase ligase N-terminal domain-containing protein [archaeon]
MHSKPSGPKTPEGTQGLKYVIQFHRASHDHYDLRLEMDGVLKSWAVPKEPPKEVGTKRLCIQVEDHVLEYGNFEGEIEEGYGKGTVKIWDKGTYDLENRKDSKIVFILHGKKLKGKYTILKFAKAGENSWLLFKAKD